VSDVKRSVIGANDKDTAAGQIELVPVVIIRMQPQALQDLAEQQHWW
jgi:hypothetical protein